MIMNEFNAVKIFNAFENYIQYIHKLRVNSFYELKNLVKEKPLRKLLYDTKRLHIFFYNGELEMNEEDAVEEFNRIYANLNKRVTKL